jgi:hypothetical protein
MIKLTYLTELALEGETLRFVLPTTIAPRYVPHDDAITEYATINLREERGAQICFIRLSFSPST